MTAADPRDGTEPAMSRRMVNQLVWRPVSSDVPGVVRSLVAMQAQEFPYALWSIAQRIAEPTTRDDLLRAFDDGAILRTHVLRPTWHFAVPADIRWLLRLTAPKLRRMMASYTRQHGLDAAKLTRSQDLLAERVRDGNHCTRRELAAALEAAGVSTGGLRLGFILMHAEYDEVLISGAMQGKQQTYAAFDERVPPGPGYDEDQALAELARRYVATRAPVTAKDLAGWASLTLTQARRGLAAVESECVVTEIDGMSMWSMPGAVGPAGIVPDGPVVNLIQGYDELIMSYFESRGLLTGAEPLLPVPDWSSFTHAILVDGRLAGHWRHQFGKCGAVVEVQLRRPLRADELTALAAAGHLYGDYLGVPTTVGEPVLLI